MNPYEWILVLERVLLVMTFIAMGSIGTAVWCYAKYADERDLRLREEENKRKVAGL